MSDGWQGVCYLSVDQRTFWVTIDTKVYMAVVHYIQESFVYLAKRGVSRAALLGIMRWKLVYMERRDNANNFTLAQRLINF